MPFDVAEDELRQLFMQFGGVRYCRLVSNPDTGMGRGRHTLTRIRVISFLRDFSSLIHSSAGSAFVQFYDPTAVQHCLEAASVKPQQVNECSIV